MATLLELPICSDVVGTLPRGILDSKVSPRGFAPIARDDRALVVGLLGAEGPRGLGMATPWATWTGPPHLFL